MYELPAIAGISYELSASTVCTSCPKKGTTCQQAWRSRRRQHGTLSQGVTDAAADALNRILGPDQEEED